LPSLNPELLEIFKQFGIEFSFQLKIGFLWEPITEEMKTQIGEYGYTCRDRGFMPLLIVAEKRYEK
jgi:hypothetical protein